MLGFIALITGLYTLVTARPSGLRLPRAGPRRNSRRGRIGAVPGRSSRPLKAPDLAATAEDSAIDQPETGTPSPSLTPTHTTPKPKPSPTKTADVAPLDLDEMPTAGENADAPSDQPEYGTTALALQESLDIKGRAPKTGYERDDFGPACADVDRNGCDRRIICTL